VFLLALMYAQKPYQWITRLDLEPSLFVAPKRRTYLFTLFGQR
jgi:hypothetical protein